MGIQQSCGLIAPIKRRICKSCRVSLGTANKAIEINSDIPKFHFNREIMGTT
ncbi:hypothetical protein SynA1825c_01879 [Synechococcus sp. A18-25c]|nr:hypothetical protein SynA1825c_01879 [Synechococcus sp. A18-25c]